MATCNLQAVGSARLVDGLHCDSSRSQAATTSSRAAVTPLANGRKAVLRQESGYLGTKLRQAQNSQFSRAYTRSLRIEAAKKVSSDRSLVLTSTLVAQEGKEEDVMKLCKGILAWADERKKDKKCGVLQFECSVDAYEKNVIHFWERYDSFPNMNDARASPEHCKFMDEVRPMLADPVALAAYEFQNGQLGCMRNPIGPKGEGGLDDATGQGGSGGGASYQQTSAGVQQGVAGMEEEKKVWGLDRALNLSSKQAAAAQEAAIAATNAAQKIADGLANLFGSKKKK